MSKYTKALEKIQQNKLEKEHGESPYISAFNMNESENEKSIDWQHGIVKIKNAIPDRRVVTFHFSDASVSEQYRMLKLNLKNHLAGDFPKVIMVSSSVNGEGKSVTAANLAVSLAEDANTKVALVDADLRRGRIGEYMGIGRKLEGVSEFLMSEDHLNIKKIMYKSVIENLIVIPAGKLMINPSRLISSGKIRELVTELRAYFDYVIVDTPPIMPVADAGIIGRDVDGLLMVIQVGRTPKSVIAHSNQLFKQTGAKLLGYVLTNVEYQSSDYKYYRYNYYRDGMEKERKGMGGWISKKAKKAGTGFQNLEENFNQWWDKKVLKKESQQTGDEGHET